MSLKGEKIIIWAHNAHLMKKTSTASYREKCLGEFIHEEYSDNSICIGQFTGEGTIEHMPRQFVHLQQLPNSIEEFIVNNIDEIAVYKSLRDKVFNKKIMTMCPGLDPDEIIPSECFDALILHRNGSVPVRL